MQSEKSDLCRRVGLCFLKPPHCRRGAGVGVSRRGKCAGGGGGGGIAGELAEWGQTQHNKLKEKFVFLGRRRVCHSAIFTVMLPSNWQEIGRVKA